MIIVVPKECDVSEHRVSAVPASVEKLIKLGYSVLVETGAGAAASFTDEAYRTAGAEIVSDKSELFSKADIILKVLALNDEEMALVKAGTTVISFVWAAQNEELLKKYAEKNINLLAIDSVPRISRAQKMDALSSMANIGGYRAVIEAAHHFGRFLTGQITAAGKVPPAKVLVIGAGVAGLAAIGTAKSMGAVVTAFDTRPEVKEQVESMGGRFLTVDVEEDGSGSGGYAKVMSKEFIDAEMALFREQAKDVDIVITTALIPGRPAPKLWLEDMVQMMKEGSVVVDLAGEQGGNCDLTVPGEAVVREGVTIIGYTNLPSRLPTQASTLYATNLVHLLTDLTPEKDGNPVINMDDVVIRGVTVVKDGEVTYPPPAVEVSAQPRKKEPEPVPVIETKEKKKTSTAQIMIYWAVAGAAALGLGRVAPPEFVSHFTVFVLAVFIGWQVIWNVTHALHTPLMSVTNAISGIVVVGSLLQVSGSGSWLVTLMAAIGILVATINIAGGFFVTQRMLKMFRK
ncbi:MAG: NAD(P)(+) transhydrogenase (Re/Si-specific) subunit alpha [Proteobacteria bacterium]|nr:MAG: NAD(P)(+) transhydrogenase (Re/Si-specific) subunit alpha [Pseudomonadota bacterium]PIE64980.1 MAG: NAD(P)(+) transhydrogenase (Re/Si-specific) subunit alpha [Desulfobacterales bacterium]